MNNEQFRTVTGKTSIPAGTLGTGTVAPTPTVTNMLTGTGTTFTTDFHDVWQVKRNDIWIYAPVPNLIARVTGVLSDTQLVADTSIIGIPAGSIFHVVKGDLIQWGVTNNGGGTGKVAGQDLPDGKSVNQSDLYYSTNIKQRHLTAITADGSGTSLVISEVR